MRKLLKLAGLLISAIIAVIVLALMAWFRPIPVAQPVFEVPAIAATGAPALAWPATGQAALGVKGYGVVDTKGDQTAAPTASVAKVFTALAVLKQKPLSVGQQGPIITIKQPDLDSYESYFSQGGSLVPVALGETLTERQALEAMMLPSANNMADTLARWAFGSVNNYTSYANRSNASLGLRHTHIDDASGFSEKTVSSAEDLVKVGQLVVNNPVLASIVAETDATIPVANAIHNTNFLLGTDGINGIKTGNTDAAGGCFMFSTVRQIGGKNITIIGAVMAAPTLQSALSSSRDLTASVNSGFVRKQGLVTGQEIGHYDLPWGKQVPIIAARPSGVTGWYSKSPIVNYSADEVTSVKKDQHVGGYFMNSGFDNASTDLIAEHSSGQAPWRWRLYQRYL